jgi:hypothetical protein
MELNKLTIDGYKFTLSQWALLSPFNIKIWSNLQVIQSVFYGLKEVVINIE